jgi:apolipoprotein N-acyltransferase
LPKAWIAPTGASFVLGAASVLGFAPFGFAPVPVLALAALFALFDHCASPAAAARLGFAFGLGLFGIGVSWVYIALSTFGGMPALRSSPRRPDGCAYASALHRAAHGSPSQPHAGR